MGDFTCNDYEARCRMYLINSYYRRDIRYAARIMGVTKTRMMKIYRDTWKNMSADERKTKATQYRATVEELDRVINGKRTPAKQASDMGWFESGGFAINIDPAKDTYRFRVTFHGTQPAGKDFLAETVSKTDLLGMRREINRALKQDKETQDENH